MDLDQLSQAVQSVIDGRVPSRPHPRSVGVHCLEALRFGHLHEWFADAGPHESEHWQQPLGLILEMASAASAFGASVWIGRRCWPHPVALARLSHRFLRACVFVQPSGREDKVWAIDLALRSEGVAAVIADGHRLTFSESRRLQLAAEAGGSLGLLLRPHGEIGEPSAARTRWRVSPRISDDSDQRWTIDLLRCKGMRPIEEARRWAAQRSHATGHVNLVPLPAHRSVQTQDAAVHRQAV